MKNSSGFTLLELLVVIAIISILAIVVVIALNPGQLLAQSRDATRVADMATLDSALSVYQTDQLSAAGYSVGTPYTVQMSVPDASSTCGDLGLPFLGSGNVWGCAPFGSYRNVNGTGWVPVNFSAISAGAPFGSLPVDPTNNPSSDLYYTYTTDGTYYEVTAAMESTKYQKGGSGDVISKDGASLSSVYAKGTSLTLEPLDYGPGSIYNIQGIVGYWPLNEGSGTTAIDSSGNNQNGTWGGSTPYYYSPGNNQAYAGNFNGSNDYVSLPRVIQDDFTMTAWFKTTTVGGGSGQWYNGRQIVSGEVCGVVNDFGTSINSSGQIMFGIGNPDTTITGSTNFADGNWHFLTATRVKSTGAIVLYVDGAVQATGVVSNTGSLTSPPNIDIGTDPCGGNYFSGQIEGVRMYSSALSSPEVKILYNAGK